MNFGNVDLAITVPRDHLVVASGVLQNPEECLTKTQQERFAAARKSARHGHHPRQEEVGDPTSRPAGDGPLTWRFRAENVRTSPGPRQRHSSRCVHDGQHGSRAIGL
jgi:hypothetical protein